MGGYYRFERRGSPTTVDTTLEGETLIVLNYKRRFQSRVIEGALN